jgi:MFS superfamily sulfate permease-like transporter
MTGAIAFMGGVLRLGFLDSVLSRPLLRGFISGVGFVIFVDQLLVCILIYFSARKYLQIQ